MLLSMSQWMLPPLKPFPKALGSSSRPSSTLSKFSDVCAPPSNAAAMLIELERLRKKVSDLEVENDNMYNVLNMNDALLTENIRLKVELSTKSSSINIPEDEINAIREFEKENKELKRRVDFLTDCLERLRDDKKGSVAATSVFDQNTLL